MNDHETLAACAPHQSRARTWREVLSSTLRHTKITRVNVAAGAFAYRWFLAIFPIVIALLGVASLVTVPRRVVLGVVQGVTKSLPSGAAQVFTKAISHATTHHGLDLGATVVACVVALWSATSAMVIVEEGLDMAYGLARDRSFLRQRTRALALLVGATVLGGIASGLIVFGPQLGGVLNSSLPGGTALRVTGVIVRFVVALALMNLLMTLLYNLALNRPRTRWRWTSWGALLATAIWATVSLGFSFYTAHFGSYGRTYGAFAGVAILIFWLYLTGIAILIGGEVNASLERNEFGTDD